MSSFAIKYDANNVFSSVIVMFAKQAQYGQHYHFPLAARCLWLLSSYLYRAPGAGAATDEVPQVGREDALQDPLLVLPRRPARAVTAHHAARWKEERGQ